MPPAGSPVYEAPLFRVNYVPDTPTKKTAPRGVIRAILPTDPMHPLYLESAAGLKPYGFVNANFPSAISHTLSYLRIIARMC